MNWDDFRHLHRDPRAVALWRGLLGPVLPWLNPSRRRVLLGIGAFAVAARLAIEAVRPVGKWWVLPPHWDVWPVVAALMIAFVVFWFFIARRFDALPRFVTRRPLVFLHASFWPFVAVLWCLPDASSWQRGVLAAFAAILPFLLWRLAYMLQMAQRGRMSGTRFNDHALYVWPVWGGTDTPYGKGLDYLASVEAKDADALARSQLAGLKLFILAFACAVGHRVINGAVFGVDNLVRTFLGDAALDLPAIREILADGPGAQPPWVAWIAVYGDLFVRVLKLAVYGHVVVGYARLCGFYVFRNTYKPLLAETIIEFWNRFYYYFKELLVHFFFIPTFVARFKRSPRLRLLAAVFASAFLGNVYYHVIQDDSLLARDWNALSDSVVPRLSYAFLLAGGIYVSMLRQQARQGAAPARHWARRALAILGVWTFYGVIRIFHEAGATPLGSLRHLLAFVGIGPGKGPGTP